MAAAAAAAEAASVGSKESRKLEITTEYYSGEIFVVNLPVVAAASTVSATLSAGSSVTTGTSTAGMFVDL